MSGTLARSLGALGDAIGGTANVNFDANTLFVDGVNNRVGIGTSTPGYGLTLVGSGAQISPGTSAQEGVRIQRASGVCTFSGINNDNNAFNALSFFTSASEAMRIDTSGRVVRPQQPAFAAWNGSGIITTSSYQTCVFTNATTNIGSHYNTSNGRFTVPVTGLYHFSWFISQSGTATGPVSTLFVNGGGISFASPISYGTAYNSAGGSVVLSLNVNDFVDVRVIGFNNSFSTVDFGYSGFCGFLI